MRLKGKRVLITAGSTWVPIDSVRVISNIATGATGTLLAQKLQKEGAKVTLLIGPVETPILDKRIRLVHFRFFGELKRIILKELTFRRYDIVIHSAAVADYRPQKILKKKVKSGIKQWRLNLVPTPKIIDLIKKIDRTICLVGFKFQPQATKAMLIRESRKLMRCSGSDLVIANTINRNRYTAYIINQNKIYGPIRNRRNLAKKLINIITSYELPIPITHYEL